MYRKISAYISSLVAVAVFALFGFVAAAVPAGAQGLAEEACTGFQEALGESCDSNTAGGEIDSTIQTAVDIISIVVAVIAVIMIIVGGIKYVTSGGDAGSTKSARDSIIYAIVGLVIVSIAQFIVRFVVGEVTSDNP